MGSGGVFQLAREQLIALAPLVENALDECSEREGWRLSKDGKSVWDEADTRKILNTIDWSENWRYAFQPLFCEASSDNNRYIQGLVKIILHWCIEDSHDQYISPVNTFIFVDSVRRLLDAFGLVNEATDVRSLLPSAAVQVIDVLLSEPEDIPELKDSLATLLNGDQKAHADVIRRVEQAFKRVCGSAPHVVPEDEAHRLQTLASDLITNEADGRFANVHVVIRHGGQTSSVYATSVESSGGMYIVLHRVSEIVVRQGLRAIKVDNSKSVRSIMDRFATRLREDASDDLEIIYSICLNRNGTSRSLPLAHPTMSEIPSACLSDVIVARLLHRSPEVDILSEESENFRLCWKVVDGFFHKTSSIRCALTVAELSDASSEKFEMMVHDHEPSFVMLRTRTRRAGRSERILVMPVGARKPVLESIFADLGKFGAVAHTDIYEVQNGFIRRVQS